LLLNEKAAEAEEIGVARFKKILVLNNEVEARLLDAVLSEQEIPHLMRSYHDRAYDGLWQQQQGWGHVEAPDDFEERILSIYDDLHSESGET
jgi:hypothetical protein